MSSRKFYRTVIQVEVLSEGPLTSTSLSDVAYAITDGDCSGKVEVQQIQEINGKRMAALLAGQSSDPGFFMLDDEGNDTE